MEEDANKRRNTERGQKMQFSQQDNFFLEKTRRRGANETVQSKRGSVRGGHKRRNPINLSFDDAFEKERRRRRNRIQEQMKQ